MGEQPGLHRQCWGRRDVLRSERALEPELTDLLKKMGGVRGIKGVDDPRLLA